MTLPLGLYSGDSVHWGIEGHMRHEIEIGLPTLNGNKFIGTITPKKQNFQITRIGSMTSQTLMVCALPSEVSLLRVCVPECHFPINSGFFPINSGKSSFPNVRENPLPGPVSVPPFRTCYFPSCFRSGTAREFPRISGM